MLTKGVLRTGGFESSTSPHTAVQTAHCHDCTARVQQRHLVLTPGSAFHLFCGWHICVSSQASLLDLLEWAEKVNKLW